MSYKKILSTIDELIHLTLETDSASFKKKQELNYLLEHTFFNDNQLKTLRLFADNAYQSYIRENDAVAREWYNPAHMRLRENSHAICYLSSYAAAFVVGAGFSAAFMPPEGIPPILLGSLTGIVGFLAYALSDIADSYEKNKYIWELSPKIVSGIYMHKFRAPEIRIRTKLKNEVLHELQKESSNEQTKKYVFQLPASN